VVDGAHRPATLHLWWRFRTERRNAGAGRRVGRPAPDLDYPPPMPAAKTIELSALSAYFR
jgi:hypothetical protein